MSKNKNNPFISSSYENKRTYMLYLDQILEIAIARYKWDGLPKTIDERFLELTLCGRNGTSLFFFDEDIGHLALPCTLSGRWNVYNIPIQRRAYASNGYQANRDDTNSVIIYANQLHNGMSIYNRLVQYAKDLYLIDSIIMINVNAQKTPLMILSDEKQMLTLKNLYMKYDGNQPFIFGNKNDLNPNSIQAMATGAPYVADKLYELKQNIWNEVLTFLGVPNVQVTKKERLITDEVNRGLGGVFASRYSGLLSRKQACEQINDMFGFNLSVEYRNESETDNMKADNMEQTDQNGGDE